MVGFIKIMSYYSDEKYAKKQRDEDLWFERLYFKRWFGGITGPILDVGCATGNFMAVKPEIFEGVEIDEESVNIAKSRGLKSLSWMLIRKCLSLRPINTKRYMLNM